MWLTMCGLFFQEYVQRFLQNSHVRHPSKRVLGGLGLTAIALTPDLIEALTSNGHSVPKEPGGMFVWKVIDGTPAQRQVKLFTFYNRMTFLPNVIKSNGLPGQVRYRRMIKHRSLP